MRLASPALALFLAVVALLVAVPAGTASAEDIPSSAAETARKENVERLAKDLRKMVASPHARAKKDEIRKDLEALGVLGGADAAKAALEALPLDDEEVEADVMRLVEAVHAKSLVAPLAALLEHRDHRRRFRLHRQIAHALAVIADVSALEPLTNLLGSEDSHVVAAAADALATFRSAPHAKRVEPVRRLLDVFESTYNLKESRRPEDRIATARAKQDWEIYGAALRKALQTLTGQVNLTRPKQFRDWWNDHKKATNW